MKSMFIVVGAKIVLTVTVLQCTFKHIVHSETRAYSNKLFIIGYLCRLALLLSEYTLLAHFVACGFPGLKEPVCLLPAALGQGLWLEVTGHPGALEKCDASGMFVLLQDGPYSLSDWRPLTLSYLEWLRAPTERQRVSLFPDRTKRQSFLE